MHHVALKPSFHRNQDVIGIAAPYIHELDMAIRKLKGVRWSQTNKFWYLPLNRLSHQAIVSALQPLATIDETLLQTYVQKKRAVASTIVTVSKTKQNSIFLKPLPANLWKLSTENVESLRRFIEQLKLKAYSASTIRTYRNEFLQLLQLIKNKPVNELTPDDLRRYLLYCFEKLKLSENTLHSRINAIKFYFEQVLGREKFFWEIPRPKKTNDLPKTFNQEEIAAIINSTKNKKHKVMLMLAYSAGLRVSEVVALKAYEIDSKRMSILIRQAKGKKDRMVTLSPVMLVMLREYAAAYKPDKQGYLFEGSVKGEPYSSRSLQEVLQAAKNRAGIIKPGSIHALRHSFATHLLDKGTDVTMIQKLLGHNDIKTTLRYLHTTNKDLLKIISPLDDLNLL